MSSFVHLHVHSAYSLSEGALTISRLRDLCRANAMPAVAVTDTNNLFGALEASEMLSAGGVQPIPGVQLAVDAPALRDLETRDARPASLVLLAQSEAGYRNLMKLSSAAFLSPAREGVVSVGLEALCEFSNDLICLTGGFDGPVDRLLRAGRSDDAGRLLDRLARAFPNRLYVELQRHAARARESAEAGLVDFAYAAGLPLVATNEPFFPAADDYDAHDALLCIAEGAYVHQENRRQATPDHYFKSAAEMTALFADLPEAVETTLEIARRCAFRPRTRAPILPQFLVAGENGAGEGDVAALEALELAAQARRGLEARLADVALAAPSEAYWSRLDIELGIINRMGFAGYFLIVADFIKWAKAAGIPVGPGRGSGAGSLVAWALTITDLDPLRFGLLFERFLNPERVSMPDFDVDFCQDRRDEVIRYVRDRYGADRVAQIITFGKLQARAVLRDVGRVLGMPYGQVERLCKLVPNNPANPVTLAEALESEPRLREERDREEAVASLIEKALKLEGLYRHASTHAAGVVIGDRPLDEITPLYRDPRAPMPATQFNMKWVEPAGLVKFDFLGLKTLTVINRAAAFAEAAGAPVAIGSIPLDDAKTFAMLGEGAAVGVFQLESVGMRATLRAMKPDSLEDIIALVSLYRPGPMENIPTYVERKHGREAPDYLHPKLESVLKETYGVIIYQEQVMQIAQILSGYSLGEADLLRRAMGKKKQDEMDRQRKRFVDGAEANGVAAAKASSIFDLVQKFAGYGFNKSHAAAYALIAYQTGWLKANRPAAFFAASMSLDRTNTDKLAIFVKEAERSGVTVLPPHINQSDADFSVNAEAVLYALSAVKNVGEGAMGVIVAERRRSGPYTDIFDFAERVDLRLVGKRAFENLARAGALDGLAPSRSVAAASADILVKHSAATFDDRRSAQGGLFDGTAGRGADGAGLERPRLAEAEDWSPLEALGAERGALGFFMSGHPLDEYVSELAGLGVLSSQDTAARARGERFSAPMAGVVRSVRFRRSRTGKPFAWIGLSDAAGDFEATAFSEAIEAARDHLKEGALLFLTVTVEERDGEVRLTAESLRPLDAVSRGRGRVRISVASAAALGPVRKKLEAARPRRPDEGGPVVARLRLPESGREVDVDLGIAAACPPSVRGALRAIAGVTDVEFL